MDQFGRLGCGGAQPWGWQQASAYWLADTNTVTACFVDSKIELFTSGILPQKKAYIKDTIINIGHKIFNIFIPVMM